VQYRADENARATGCVEHLKCCDAEKHKIQDWVEERVFSGNFPQGQLPLPSCYGGNREEKCRWRLRSMNARPV
jgi:hypothetical protein